MSNTQAVLAIDEITAHTLRDYLKHMANGDSLIMVKNGEKLEFVHRKEVNGRRVNVPVKNSLIRTVGFSNTKGSWVVSSPSSAFPSWQGFGKTPKKPVKSEKVRLDELKNLRDGLDTQYAIETAFTDAHHEPTITSISGIGAVDQLEIEGYLLYRRAGVTVAARDLSTEKLISFLELG
jgi:hypothetical protein